jgi:hypothetical protein
MHMSEAKITELLSGTAWQGSLTTQTVPQETIPIRIVFLSEPSVSGALLYFHQLKGNVPAVLKLDDNPCRFTPRALKLERSSIANTAVGTIFIFECAETEKQERELGNKSDRRPMHTVKDVRIIYKDGDELTINAHIGVDVEYKLKKQAVPESAQRLWLKS